MSNKTFRFTEEDERKLETIKWETSSSLGIDSDIGVIRFLISQHLSKKTEVVITPVVEANDEYMKAKLAKVEASLKKCIETNDLCPIHQKGVNDCGCVENGKLREKLMDIY